MVNDKIQYTGKFDMLTYIFGTNSVVVLSPDCIYWLEFSQTKNGKIIRRFIQH